MSKHTPWRFDAAEAIYRVVDADGRTVARVAPLQGARSNSEQREIAHLISSAPDLLERLRLAICPVCGYMFTSPRPGAACACDADRAAIAKAEGR